VSICLLYLRIFNHIKWFRITIYCIIAVVGLYAVSSIVATIAECVPTARVWDHHVEGKCIDLTKFWYANASVNIIGDFVIFLVPMPLVWNMQLPVRQRLGLGLVFSLGLL